MTTAGPLGTRDNFACAFSKPYAARRQLCRTNKQRGPRCTRRSTGSLSGAHAVSYLAPVVLVLLDAVREARRDGS